MSENTFPAAEYVAPDPMPTDRIHLETLVYVPMWRSGSVIRWGHAHVIEINRADDSDPPTSYIVRLTHPLSGTSAEVLYFPYSIRCGLCVDQPSATPCPQCRPPKPGKYALSIETGGGIPPDGNEPTFDSVDDARDAFTTYVNESGAQYSEYYGVTGWLYFTRAWDGISYGDAAEAKCLFTIGPGNDILTDYC